tara:strand:- start:21287 stop:22261 length:975 start_codon:yes stop_codon:yes gene_type:complete
MKVNICGNRFQTLDGNWERILNVIIASFIELDIECCVSNYLQFNTPYKVTKGIIDSNDDIYLYNHTYLEDILANNFNTGKKTLFFKPTAPTPDYFSLDIEGYACASDITYNKPLFTDVDETKFFKTKVKEFKTERVNKWSESKDLQFSRVKNIPKDHILILGQMPGDETVTKFSFGSHWQKVVEIVNFLKKDYNIVLKIHPTLKPKDAWIYYQSTIDAWEKEGVIVFSGFESLHDILPHTKVAITENSTSGIECMMYDVPIISYGYPEYHWITKDLRHLQKIKEYINNLSWFNKLLSRKWLAWYCLNYLCYNKETTIARLKTIL